jgi:hypothetical protein
MGYIEEQLPEITKKYKQEAQFPVVDSRGMDFPLVIVKLKHAEALKMNLVYPPYPKAGNLYSVQTTPIVPFSSAVRNPIYFFCLS